MVDVTGCGSDGQKVTRLGLQYSQPDLYEFNLSELPRNSKSHLTSLSDVTDEQSQ